MTFFLEIQKYQNCIVLEHLTATPIKDVNESATLEQMKVIN